MASIATASRVDAREALFKAYSSRIAVDPRLDRSLVSFQANKDQPIYRWFKYKEGFSSRLVQHLIRGVEQASGTLLDPFGGAGAALFSARDVGWSSIGIELLPVGAYVIEARLAADIVDPAGFSAEVDRAIRRDFAKGFHRTHAFRHIRITEGAFPNRTEKAIGGYLRYCEEELQGNIERLFRFACFSVLEEVSYTRKDGQYLRWDARSNKSNGSGKFDKGKIPSFQEAVRRKLRMMASDLRAGRASGETLFAEKRPPAKPVVDFRRGSCLEILPTLPACSVDMVLTSPPYCNRYDYTRTYALELAFLGYDDEQVKLLRQSMLSCTVENRDKTAELTQIYSRDAGPARFLSIQRAYEKQEALWEVLDSLEAQRKGGQLNNPNIVRMVRHYFLEMCFVVAEVARVLRAGGKVFMVNDNVRYGGEEVPVDLILGDFARGFGLRVRQILTLPRGKGNSSQQMGSHGRRELRKCVYIWEKPASAR